MNCPNCGSDKKTTSDQIFKDGTRHLRVDCTKCGRFLSYATRRGRLSPKSALAEIVNSIERQPEFIRASVDPLYQNGLITVSLTWDVITKARVALGRFVLTQATPLGVIDPVPAKPN